MNSHSAGRVATYGQTQFGAGRRGKKVLESSHDEKVGTCLCGRGGGKSLISYAASEILIGREKKEKRESAKIKWNG